ncbi:MAG: hypothetical protein M0R34_09420 [Candidatus Marinimicrobia bacterium]|jgi:hypothetical protein|nr:hypothetical protein [Candidatus Neomarinimicrobiota bacterium]MCK9559772.1 hypothetical protein [Candidatus Neomarinimicrobiota bacterium]MDD5539531.1 hypothetical protein [Candidatus Neomarinimicrobiota bacterium]
MMNKIISIIVCFWLLNCLYAQEPTLPGMDELEAAPADTIIQESETSEPVSVDSVSVTPVIPETETAEPILQAETSEEQPAPEEIAPEPISQEPLPEEVTAEPITREPLPEEPTIQEPTPRTPAPKPPIQEGLIPPEEVFPALVSTKTAPMRPSELTNYGQMIYWKSLNTAEKKVFLYAYLYRTYETLQQVKYERDLKSASKVFQKKIADPVFNIYRQIDESLYDDLIFWIDKFYRIDLNKDKSFNAALRYASEKMKTGSQSLHELFKENY